MNNQVAKAAGAIEKFSQGNQVIETGMNTMAQGAKLFMQGENIVLKNSSNGGARPVLPAGPFQEQKYGREKKGAESCPAYPAHGFCFGRLCPERLYPAT